MYTHTYIIYIYMYIEKDSSRGTSVIRGGVLRGKDRILNYLQPEWILIFKNVSSLSLFLFTKRRRRAFEKCRVSLSNPIADVSPPSPLSAPSPLSPILVFFPGHVSTIKKTLSVGKWDARETASCNNFLREWPATALHEERRKRRQPRK